MRRGPENPFAGAATACLYARGRPDHHRRTVERVAALLAQGPVERALDVACGTGLSTAALTAVAGDVVGVDAASEMVRVARRSVAAEFAVADAERLPFGPSMFGLVSVASAVHWFEQDAFFSEARRVLHDGGVVAVTEHFFLGEMDGEATFGTWMREAYAARYPTPRRGRHLTTTDDVPDGFELIGKDGWVDPIVMGRDALVDYLLTQSNTIAAVEAGRETRASVRDWLRREVRPFFGAATDRTLRFWGSAACYRCPRR